MARNPFKRSDPTKEIGVPAQTVGMYGLLGGSALEPWSNYIEDREYAPDLMFPTSVATYQRMQTDAQIKGLLLATSLPIRRFRWEIDPNGCNPKVAQHEADSLGLPIRGEEPPPRRQAGRFNHDRHLAHALRALGYGFFDFEIVMNYAPLNEGGDGLLRLEKLGTRPPRTIGNVYVGEHGELVGVEQNIFQPTGGGLAQGPGVGVLIPAERLVPYVWDSEDDGDWLGKSMLRPCFRNWLIKDRLLRVDATKHERNGMGIPWFEVDPAATDDQIQNLGNIAAAMRSGEEAGGAGPGKLHLVGTEGEVPDTIASVRYHDEQMSKAFLLLFFNLGTTETGSRALGSEFIDWYTQGQSAIADWYAQTTQEYVIEREVAMNWGTDEQPPLLTYTRLEDEDLAFADLLKAVEANVIELDDELRHYVVDRWKLPHAMGAVPVKAKPAPPALAPPPPGLPPGGEGPGEAGPPEGEPEVAPGSARQRMAQRLLSAAREPISWPELARRVGVDRRHGTARRARDELLASGALAPQDGTLVASGPPLPTDRTLHRAPSQVEVAARVDFARMDQVYKSSREVLIEALEAEQAAQIAEVGEQVRKANGSAVKLATISVAPADAEVLAAPMQACAIEGVEAARAEHATQEPAVTPAAAKLDLAGLEAHVGERAEVLAATMANYLGASASKQAAQLSSLDPSEAATQVEAFLSGLSGAAVREQAAGATMQSYNGGRREYMRAASADQLYASELLDENTCGECAEVDGTEYDSIEDAEADYPLGGYVECEGGLYCRGTLVAVYKAAREVLPDETPEPSEPAPASVPGGASEEVRLAAAEYDETIQSLYTPEANVPFSAELREELLERGETIGQAIREGSARIDEVMDWPEIEGAGVLRGQLYPGSDANAAYVPRAEILKFNVEAQMGAGARWRGTTAHEMGHRLDHLFGAEHWGSIERANDALYFASSAEDAGPIAELLATIDESRQASIWRETPLVKQSFKDYLNEPREKFARAFAQFIAVESGDEEALAWMLKDTLGQWQPLDFEPIRESMRDLLNSKGLLK